MKQFALGLMSLFALSPQLALANLSCHVFNEAGQPLPASVQVLIPAHGPVGQANGAVVLLSQGFHQVEPVKLSFSNPQTRCAAGPAIQAASNHVNANLFSFDACAALPPNLANTPATFKGEFVFSKNGKPQNLYLACNGTY